MWGQLVAAGVTLAAFALLVWALMKASARGGAMEANAEAERRQMDALKQSEKVKDETLARMADASADSVSDTADSARERMHKRPPSTR